MQVSNSSNKDVSRVEITLIEIVTYTARRHNRLMESVVVGVVNDNVEKKQESRHVIQYNEEFKLARDATAVYQRALEIPPIVPSFNVCPIIQVDYRLKVVHTLPAQMCSFCYSIRAFLGQNRHQRRAKQFAVRRIARPHWHNSGVASGRISAFFFKQQPNHHFTSRSTKLFEASATIGANTVA